MSKPTNLGQWATNGGTTVEPVLAEKQAGWLNAKKLPARWLNWWMNNQYLWNQWLDAYESTPHTWTAKQTFNDVIVNDGGTNSSAALEATGSGSRSGLLGTSGSTTGAYGSKGVGVNGGAFGKHGQLGTGGTGTTLGGTGQVGVGGDVTGAGAGTAGQGGQWFGGNVNGASNTLANAGKAGVFKGGDVTADANGRVGGIAVEATGGLGQNGYAYAFHAVHGGLVLDDGVIVADNNVDPHVLGTTQIDGDETVNGILAVLGATNLTGLLSAGGGIALEAVTAPTLVNSWVNVGSGFRNAGYWKDPFGVIHLQGHISGGSNSSVAFVLPGGYRPGTKLSFHGHSSVIDVGPGASYIQTVFVDLGTVVIDTSGNVTITFQSPSGGSISLEGITFRP